MLYIGKESGCYRQQDFFFQIFQIRIPGITYQRFAETAGKSMLTEEYLQHKQLVGCE